MDTPQTKADQVEEYLLGKKAEQMRRAEKQRSTPFRRILVLSAPIIFAAFIAFLALRSPDIIPSPLISFICFLPMVFYFSAQATYTELSALDRRIAALEKTLAEMKNA